MVKGRCVDVRMRQRRISAFYPSYSGTPLDQ